MLSGIDAPDKADAVVEQRPLTVPCLIEDEAFLTAADIHSPDAWFPFDVIEVSAIRRFESLITAIDRHLYGPASSGGPFPDLPVAASIGGEVDPLPVGGPARQDIIGILSCQTSRQTAFRADQEDIALPFGS